MPPCPNAPRRASWPILVASAALAAAGCGARSGTLDDPPAGAAPGACRWRLGAPVTVVGPALSNPRLAVTDTPAGPLVAWSTTTRADAFNGPWTTDWNVRLVTTPAAPAHEIRRVIQPSRPFGIGSNPISLAWTSTGGAFLTSHVDTGCLFASLGDRGAPAGEAAALPQTRCLNLQPRAEGFRFLACEEPPPPATQTSLRCEAVDVDARGVVLRRSTLPARTGNVTAAPLADGALMLVWADFSGAAYQLRAARVEETGAVLEPPTDIATVGGGLGALQALQAQPLGDGSLLTWIEARSGSPNGEGLLMVLDGRGRPTAAQRIFASPDDPARVRLFAAGDSILRVASEDRAAGGPTLSVSPLDAVGAPAGAALLVQRGRFVTDARVAATAAGATLVYAAHADDTGAATSSQNAITAVPLRCAPL